VIVVDSNIVAYYWINGPLMQAAWQVWTKDPDWHRSDVADCDLTRPGRQT
jgi:hypothetical protein